MSTIVLYDDTYVCSSRHSGCRCGSIRRWSGSLLPFSSREQEQESRSRCVCGQDQRTAEVTINGLRGGAEEAQQFHKLTVVGSSPTPATKFLGKAKTGLFIPQSGGRRIRVEVSIKFPRFLLLTDVYLHLLERFGSSNSGRIVPGVGAFMGKKRLESPGDYVQSRGSGSCIAEFAAEPPSAA